MDILLCLDLSINSTGWSTFNLKTKKLISYGVIKPKVPGISKMKYPTSPLYKILDVTVMVRDLIEQVNPKVVLIEEINKGISRISQKSLSALGFFILDAIRCSGDKLLDKVEMIDSDGFTGWRTILKLRLSDEDKKHNAKARKHNKKSKLKMTIITKKHLAQRYVNKALKKSFDIEKNKSENDICDAIGMGLAYFLK